MAPIMSTGHLPRQPSSHRGRWLLALLGCALAMPSAWAEDLPGTRACREALRQLDQAEEALMSDPATAASAASAGGDRQRIAAARLQPLRQRVADVCLGGQVTSAPPSQHSWVPLAPAAPGRLPSAPPRPPQVAMPPMPPMPPVSVPAPRVEPPVTVSHCNAATCLTSDGSTLVRVGPTLLGPRGVCTVQGVFVHCP